MSELKNKSIFPYVDPRKYKIVAFDTETHLITEDQPIPPMVCITFSEFPFIYGGTHESKLEGARRLMNYLTDDSVIIVGHNIFFDISVIIRFFSEYDPTYELDLYRFFWAKIRAGRIRDTGVTGKLLAIQKDWLRADPKMGGAPATFYLSSLAKRHLDIVMEGKEGEDVWRKRYKELDGIPLDQWEKAAIEYPINDAKITRDLYVYLISKYATSLDEMFQVESSWVLHLMGVWGICTDPVKAQELDDMVSPIIRECQKELIKEGFLRPPEYTVRRDLLKAAIAQELGDGAPKTAGGEISLTAKVFSLCKNKFVLDYLEAKPKIEYLRKVYNELAEEPIENKDRIKELINDYLAHQKDMDYALSAGIVIEEEPTQNKEKVRQCVIEFFRKESGKGYDYSNVPLTDAADKLKEEELRAVLEDVDKLRKMVSTDRETILQIPALQKLAEMGEFYKIKTTYIPIFKQGNILHPHWNPLVASGRVSVANPNLNNMPREHGVRECFKARPGYVYVTADYSQAELCSLSQICTDLFGYSKMGEAIKNNQDLHLLLASQILNITYKEAEDRHKVAKSRDKKTATEEELAWDKIILDARQMAKAANFGYPGGLGPDKFVAYAWTSYKVKLTRDKAIDLKQIWLETYPEITEFFAYVANKLGRKNWGERETSKFDVIQHRSGRIRGKVGFCDGLNTFFQGLTADGAKYAKNLISYEMYCNPKSPLYGSRIVAFIYDEILMECPEEKAHEAAMELTRLMLVGMQLFLPDIPSKVEVEMMRRWIKAAKAVYVDNRLVPFDA